MENIIGETVKDIRIENGYNLTITTNEARYYISGRQYAMSSIAYIDTDYTYLKLLIGKTITSYDFNVKSKEGHYCQDIELKTTNGDVFVIKFSGAYHKHSLGIGVIKNRHKFETKQDLMNDLEAHIQSLEKHKAYIEEFKYRAEFDEYCINDIKRRLKEMN